MKNQQNNFFLDVSGRNICDSRGNNIYFQGINLGNWLVWEGYLMMGDFKYRTHSQFFDSLVAAFASREKALEFEHQWRLHYEDEKAINDLKELGFNSLRVPFNYKIFYKDGKISNHGFQYIDRLVQYCRPNDITILLDMHGAPGFQNPGDHSDNGDSNENQPRDTVKFWDGDNVDIAAKIWAHIASYYKDEPVIWGYDLYNEPVAQDGREFEILPSFVKIRNSIRKVDPNHIIVAEASWWSSDFTKLDWTDPETQKKTGVTQAWDDKLVYQNHHYGPPKDTFGREKYAEKLNIPFFTGEFGEDSNVELAEITKWSKEKTSGHFPWSFKKMSHDRTLWTIPPNKSYERIKDFINNGGNPPVDCYEDMILFAQNNIRNGHENQIWHQGFYDAIK
jgi:endoglucanase